MIWIENKHWEYRLNFDIAGSEFEDILVEENLDLVFEGLDTFANISLNGRDIGSTDNFFRTWSFNVKGLINPKNNSLIIQFESALLHN